MKVNSRFWYQACSLMMLNAKAFTIHNMCLIHVRGTVNYIPFLIIILNHNFFLGLRSE